jgi:hypothetical protein
VIHHLQAFKKEKKTQQKNNQTNCDDDDTTADNQTLQIASINAML